MAQDDLFGGADAEAAGTASAAPLAERMRPATLEDVVGQVHLLGPDGPLRRVREGARLHSMILWGPPGSGKTTIARAFAGTISAQWVTLSAVMAGVRDIRAVVERAREARSLLQHETVLFIDEVHRFNKSQQDALLPHVEDGTLTLIGATTENPAFEINAALLSRARVYVLHPLRAEDLLALVERALDDPRRGLGGSNIAVSSELRERLVAAADGDARRLLGMLEGCVDAALAQGVLAVDGKLLDSVVGRATRRFDKGGDAFFDLISALHKSVRGSDPDASLYWLARMLDGGCDPAYVARRITRIAMEDIGLAQPAALGVCVAAWDAYRRLGSPEGELALAQAVVHLACAPKSNALYRAFNEASRRIREGGSEAVPERLRNAPTRLASSLGHGDGYRYAHDEPGAFAAGECYFPDAMAEPRFYEPSDRGAEKAIGERLNYWRGLNLAARAGTADPVADD